MAFNIKHYRILLIACILIQLFGCSSTSKVIQDNKQATIHQSNETESSLKTRHLLIQEATSLIGKPYKPSGTSPKEGFDCSGFVFYSYSKIGKLLPRSSRDQYQSARKVKKMKPGDLVFFVTRRHSKRIDHVGIYIGEQKFIHAPGKGRGIAMASLTESYWKNRYKGAGDYLD